MKQHAIFPKVATDIFFTQLKWASGFLGVLFIVNIGKLVLSSIYGYEAEGFFSSIFVAGNIFMLVVGILAIYFLPHYVGNGVTRKDYFTGTVLASIGLSITIPVIAFLVSILEQFILNMVNIALRAQTINDVDIDDNIIGDIVQSIIITPYVAPQQNWLLAIGVLSLNLFINYLIGWLISSSFYRLNVVAGLGFILLAINIKMLKDTFLRISLDLPVPGWFSNLDFLPSGIALVGILLLVIISIWLIRLLTRRVSVKL
ncbi:hypothetical protein [Sutcliffiella halmapala]|uniref:hypothetical protein n=1 Tax=Sutcliffiella halmapala TaxID=79882 RepID=UPI000994E8B2|nr:hypothetical protein [Sutcliffiella halmapala]